MVILWAAKHLDCAIVGEMNNTAWVECDLITMGWLSTVALKGLWNLSVSGHSIRRVTEFITLINGYIHIKT